METKDILKSLREKHGYTIQEVSKSIGMQYTMCREYETGSRNLGMSAAMKFANFYNVSLDYLMGRTTVKQIAIEQPDPFANIDVSALEKRIIKKYTELDESTRALCIELFLQLNPAFTAVIQEVTQQTPKTSKSVTNVEPSKPDIQVSQMRNSKFAIARGGNGIYKSAPTDEQFSQFEELTPDMLGEE